MSSPFFIRWLVALAVCAVLVTVCLLFVDLPVAQFFHDHAWHQKGIGAALQLVLLLVPLGALGVVACGIAVLAGKMPPHWAQILSLAGLATLWSIAVNDFLLKPMFGRYNIDRFFGNGIYGFAPFHGSLESSFPSGHSVIIASFLTVYWIFYPRFHWLWALLTAIVAVGLLAAGWHYTGDVFAGLFFGGTAGLITVKLWQAGPRP